MRETSLQDEYQELLPGVTKIFVVPQIPKENQNTSYLYLLYKDSKIQIVSINAISLPKIILSRIKFEKSILHYHWFEFEDLKSFIGIKWKFLWIILYKLFGGKLIWTLHNKEPHHNKFIYLNKKISRLMAYLADKIHVHCEFAFKIAIDFLKADKQKIFIVRHPNFPAEIFEKEKAVQKLNQKYFNHKLKNDNRIFLMFGAIAEYKGIKEVIEIVKSLDQKNKLIIAGFVKKGNQNYFNELKKNSDSEKIFLQGNTIPDEDVPYFLNSADYIIFNYKDILTSGGVVLAMNYRKNIIAPALGCLREIQYDKMILFDSDENRHKLLAEVINQL